MNNLSISVMMHRLSGGSKHDPADFYNLMITSATMTEEKLTLDLSDGRAIEIWDNGQSCCEWRHMTTDDDIQSLVGHKLTRIEGKEGPEIDDGECHETVFVEIGTDVGFITIVNHNEHNGYYGGFALTITLKEDAQ